MSFDLATALKGYYSATRSQAALLSEARICRYASGEHSFIKGFEGSRDDGAIYTGTDVLATSHTEKTLTAIADYKNTKCLIPIEVKDIAPRADPDKSILYPIALSREQSSTCQAVILTASTDPAFVAFVPVHCLLPLLGAPAAKHAHSFAYFNAYRPVWTLHPLPAFPPKLTPFLLPVSELGLALNGMRNYVNQVTQEWANHYTGVSFVGVPPPEQFTSSVLEPGLLNWQKAMAEVQELHAAFKDFSLAFQIEVIVFAPLFGDLKIVEIATQEEIFVEAKKGHYRICRDETGSAAMLHKSYNIDMDRRIFTWKAQWDYLWTHSPSHVPFDGRVGTSAADAYFIPRDAIPEHWWTHAPSLATDHMLKWSSKEPYTFSEYAVRFDTPDHLVRDIETILQRSKRQTNSMKPCRQIPLCPLHTVDIYEVDSHPETRLIADEDSIDGRESLEANSEDESHPLEKWSTSTFDRGYGSAAHPELRGLTYEVWAAESLIKLCRKSGTAAVLDVGEGNPICRFALARYTWSAAEKLQYDRDGEPPCRVWHFDKNTPVIPLSFMALSWAHWPQPYMGSGYLASVIAQRPTTVVICDLFPYTCMCFNHARFVFPSDQLISSTGKYKRVELRSGPIDTYAVAEEELLEGLLKVLGGQRQARFGTHDEMVPMASLCYHLQILLQATWGNFAKSQKDEG